MKKILIVWLVFLITLTGCGDYLDMVPEDDIETIETIFEKREQAEKWLRSCYTFLQYNVGSVMEDPSFTGTDEIVAGDYFRKMSNNGKRMYAGLFIGDGLQMSQDPYGSVWQMSGYYTAIRYCNIFLDNISKVYNMPDAEKRQWAAEIKGLKAYIYYELVRRYGPIVLVPQNIEVAEPVTVMQQPRSHVDTCINAIVELIDDAKIDLLPLENKDMSRWAYFSLEAALALKAKALLLGASPLFNGNPAYAKFKNKNGELLVNSIYDREKWKRAALAADTAILICENYGRSLSQESTSKPTKLLNQMNNIERSVLANAFQNGEALFMIRATNVMYDLWSRYTLPFINQSDDYNQHNTNLLGCAAPSMKMVEMYYTSRGLPIDQDREWDYASRYKMGRELDVTYRDVVPVNSDNVLRLHLRREPRFYANIAADRCYWQRGVSSSYLVQVQAYRGEVFGTSEKTINSSVPQNLTGYWLKKGSYSDVSGQDYDNVFYRDEALVLIRLAELYLIKAEAWNEYEGPSTEKVFAPLNIIRKRAGIPDVEIAWATYSKTPGKIRTKEGMREIIHREWNIEFAFEGHRFWNLRRWMTAHDELNEKLYGWNILGNNANTFYNNFDKPVVVWSKRQFQAPRDYLFPLSAEEILISGCVQNPGW